MTVICVIAALAACTGKKADTGSVINSKTDIVSSDKSKSIVKSSSAVSSDVSSFVSSDISSAVSSSVEDSFTQFIGLWEVYGYDVEGFNVSAEEEGIEGHFTVNENMTASFVVTHYGKPYIDETDLTIEKPLEEDWYYSFEFEQKDGPFTAFLMPIDDNGDLGLMCEFYYGDGTTGSTYYYLKAIK